MQTILTHIQPSSFLDLIVVIVKINIHVLQNQFSYFHFNACM